MKYPDYVYEALNNSPMYIKSFKYDQLSISYNYHKNVLLKFI